MQRLKELRKSKKLLQRDMAAKLGIERTTYVRYETGDTNPPLETLSAIADIFGVSVDYLLGRDEQTEKAPAETGEGLSPERQKAIALIKGLNDADFDKFQSYLDFLIAQENHKQD